MVDQAIMEAKKREEASSRSAITEAVRSAEAAMPSVGFFSERRRYDCFVAVSVHLDGLVQAGHISKDEAQTVVMALRLRSEAFRKAATTFEDEAPLLGEAARLLLPATAKRYYLLLAQ